MAATGRPFASRVLASRCAAGGGGGGFGGLGGGGFGGLGGSMGQPIQLFDHLVGADEQRGTVRPSAFAVREYAERAAYLARFQTASTTTPCPIDATGLVYRSSSPASVNDRF